MTTPVTYPWVGGTNFIDSKSIPITGTTPSHTITFSGTTLTHDDRIVEDVATTNYATGTIAYVRPVTGSRQRVILDCDFSAFTDAGYVKGDITQARLYAYETRFSEALDPVGRTWNLYKMLRTDWSEAQATWTIYKTGSNWTTAGCDSDGNDYDSTLTASATVPATGNWMYWDVLTLVEDAIDNESSVLWLMLKDSAEGVTDKLGGINSSENASNIWYLEIVYQPPVPNPYTVMIDLHKGTPSVEEDAAGWNINARGAFNNRYGIPIETFSALSSGQTIEVIVDTKSMVDAVDGTSTVKFFPDGTAANATKVEFVLEVAGDKETNTCKYWVSNASGTPTGFNTGGTRFYIATPAALSANTRYTFWMYFDKERCADAASSNYSAADTGIYFEDFATDAANLAAFLAAYDGDPNNSWVVDTTDVAFTLVVASSVLTLTGVTNAAWEGIATAATVGTNFHARFRITAAPGASVACGIVDAAGIGAGANVDGAYLFKNGTDEFETCLNGAPGGAGATAYSCAYPTAPFVIDICKYGAFYRYIMERNDPDYQPETYCLEYTDIMRDIPATDVAHKLFIASLGTAAIAVDSIFCYTEPEHPPTVKAPAVTYLKPGVVFGDNKHLNFPYDTAFALSDATVLYCGDDKLVQLTSEPGDTAQLAVRVPLDLASNQTIYYYAGHAAITSAAPHDHWTNASSWDEYDDFTSVADWTEEAGTWAVDDYIDPVISKAPVGNVGASPGRCWVRMPSVFKWNGEFYALCNTAMWEHAGYYWPLPYRNVIQKTSTIGTPFGTPVVIMEDEDFQGLVNCGWVQSVYVDGTYPGGTIYALVANASTSHKNGCKIWKCTAADPMDPDNWSAVTGVLMDLDWVVAHGIAAATSVVSYDLYKSGATWYIIVSGVDSDAGAFWESHTAEAPTHPWTNADFSDLVEFYDTGVAVHCEDICFAHDTPNNTTYMYYSRASTPFIHYAYLDEDVAVFPGVGSWDGNHEPTIDKASWATGYWGSPRILDNIAVDTYLYLFTHGKADAETAAYFTKWCPDWIQVTRGTNFTTFSEWNTDKKYKQTDTAAFDRAYKTGTSYADLSAVCEVQVTARFGGILYRNDDTNNNGYFALLDYNTAGTSYVRLYKYTGATLAEIGTAYTIPAWPEPGAAGYFHLNTPWRLRVDVYGGTHKVYYSRWGGPWILAKTETDNTYFLGSVGVGTYLSGAAFNEWKVRSLVNAEPTVGMYAQLGGAGMMLSGNF